MDLLCDHLARARAGGAVFGRTVATPPWGLRLPGTTRLTVHAVIRGRAWLWLDGNPPERAVELLPGEITLARGGPDHFIAHERGAVCLPPNEFRDRHASATASAAASGAPDAPEATVFLCGAYRFSGDIGNGLLDALPQTLTLRPAIGDPMRDVISLVSHELVDPQPGHATVLDRLLDVLLVLAIRSDFRRNPNAPRWYRASADPRVSPALQAMHANAGHPWSVPELAALSGLSRAAFARSFQDALGQTPMQYLTDWRMALAREHLRTGELGIAGIARNVGYGSPYAFAAAFRRHHGEPPGAWRDHESAREHAPSGADPLPV